MWAPWPTRYQMKVATYQALTELGKDWPANCTSGSTSSPGTRAETIRLGSGPVAFILPEPDVTILVAVTIAAELYDQETALLIVDSKDFQALQTGQSATLKDSSLFVG